MAEKPTIWFIANSLTAYHEFKGFIGSAIKPGIENLQLGSKAATIDYDFKNIRENDKIVFYIPSEGLIVDILTVTSKEPRRHVAFPWKEPMLVRDVFSTYQLGKGRQLNFRELIKDTNSPFKHIPNVAFLDNSDNTKVQSRGYVKLDDDEFDRIESALNSVYVTNRDISLESHRINNAEHLTGLLDFYNSRTTSFANLLVASIFGIAALSAIIQINSAIAMISVLPFMIICALILYSLFSYCYYADIAEKIKSSALISKHYGDLNKPKICLTKNGKQSFCNLIDYIQNKPKISFDSKLPLILCIIVLTGLFLMLYWTPLHLETFSINNQHAIFTIG